MFKTTLLVASQSFIKLVHFIHSLISAFHYVIQHLKIIELHGKQMNLKEYHIITNISHGVV